jgi:hypothetical protein
MIYINSRDKDGQIPLPYMVDKKHDAATRNSILK